MSPEPVERGLPDALEGDLRSILGDRTRGASEIEERLRRRLARCWGRVEEAEEEPQEGGEESSGGEVPSEGLLVFLTRSVRELQPAMANLLQLVNHSWLTWQEGGAEGDRRRALIELWRRVAGGGEGAERSPEQLLLRLARERWMAGASALTALTLSRSGTVLDGLTGLGELCRRRGVPFRVLVGEGRPGNEGFGLAADLLESGVEVTAVTDALLLALAGGGASAEGLEVRPDRAVALLGADAVGPERFVNKVGSAALARAARERGVPVWLLAGEAKTVPGELFELLELPEAPAEELGAPEGVQVRNLYFERVPLELLDLRLGEEGVEEPEALARRVAGQPVSERMVEVWSG